MLAIRHIARAAALMAVVACAATAGRAFAAANDKEAKLISTLQTGTNPEKAIACKQLAIYGTKTAVPVLAALLPDEQFSSWARIALENIPDPAADEALRDAVGKTQGKLLIGVINSIGQRRSAVAVDALTQKLKDTDTEVATAAAEAMGHIGGKAASAVLEQFLPNSPAAVRPCVAYGCILSAERFLADGNRAESIRLYDFVRKAEVPRQRIQEATRGAILARGAEGIPLLVEQLRSPNMAMFAIGVRTAREMQGPQVADAIVAELPTANADRQGLLIITLADRGDGNALPAVLAATKSGPTSVRIVAAGALERLGNASCIPVLLDAATDADAALAQAAKTTLARLRGREVDAELLARLSKSSGKTLQVLIDLAERRKIDGALAAIARCVEDSDPTVRSTALESLGAIGDEKQVADLVKLLPKVQTPKDRTDIEKSLIAICSRWGAVCTPHLLPLAQSTDPALRATAVRTLACCGPNALSAVTALVDDKDESVQDAAVRTLSTWPNRWPDDTAVTQPLLAIAKSGKKTQHQALSLRAYLQFVQGAKKLPADQRLAKITDALSLITRPEEKRLAISVLSAVGTAGSLQPLIAFAADSEVADEACAAIVDLAGKNNQGLSKEQRQKALQTVLEKAKSDATKKKAEEILQAIK
jgi:HEAT repeat protein